MSYPFPEIEKKIYPWTFLKDVSIMIGNHDDKGDNEEFEVPNDFFLSTFGLQDVQRDAFGKILISSKDDMICFEFGSNFVKLKLRFPLYKSFKQITDWAPVMLKYLQRRGITSSAHISLVKYNELNYKQNNPGNMSRMMSQVFSGELLKYHNNGADSSSLKHISRWERNCTFKDSESNSSLTAIYGYAVSDNSPQEGKLTLKTIIELNSDNIGSEDFIPMLSEYNHILDRAFHWCVTPSMVKAMENPPKK